MASLFPRFDIDTRLSDHPVPARSEDEPPTAEFQIVSDGNTALPIRVRRHSFMSLAREGEWLFAVSSTYIDAFSSAVLAQRLLSHTPVRTPPRRELFGHSREYHCFRGGRTQVRTWLFSMSKIIAVTLFSGTISIFMALKRLRHFSPEDRKRYCEAVDDTVETGMSPRGNQRSNIDLIERKILSDFHQFYLVIEVRSTVQETTEHPSLFCNQEQPLV